MTIKVFWATCPKCEREFVVSWELRRAGVPLHCPFCENRFLPEESAAIFEGA